MKVKRDGRGLIDPQSASPADKHQSLERRLPERPVVKLVAEVHRRIHAGEVRFAVGRQLGELLQLTLHLEILAVQAIDEFSAEAKFTYRLYHHVGQRRII